MAQTLNLRRAISASMSFYFYATGFLIILLFHCVVLPTSILPKRALKAAFYGIHKIRPRGFGAGDNHYFSGHAW